MKDIDNRGRVNRFKYLLYFYGLFVLVIFGYKFIFAPELPNLILLAAFSSFIVTRFGHGLHFTTVLALPITLIKLHALLRMRSTKFDKPKNDTPMTFLLRELGYME